VKTAAFLDRDGVINASHIRNGIPHPPESVLEVQILSGVLEAINLLIANSYLPVVISNQPDIARKKIELSSVQSINDYIAQETGITNFYICPHDDSDGCKCRKPKSGLIETAASDLDIDLTKSFLVGDRWRDIEAGQSLGIPSYFIDYSYSELKPKLPFIKVSSLLEAVEIRIGENSGPKGKFSKN
jgi:D-glycero-D-manno-heptose 1,7-bisphosphate phosphatase